MEKTMAILMAAIIVSALHLPISSVLGETDSPDTAIIELLGGTIQTTILQKEPEFVPGELIVKFTPEISVKSTISPKGIATIGYLSIDTLNEKYSVTSLEKVFKTAEKPVRKEIPDLSNIYILELPKDADILSIAEVYQRNSHVEYAEPNYIRYICATPNDPYYSQQWAHKNMQSEQAWDIETGNPSVVIAIVDTGVDWDHPDLAANIWNNTDEILDGTDTDGNGYIDDIRGWDFVTVDPSNVFPGEDPGPEDNDPLDFYGHGTHCSGIAGAVTNNNIGVAGMCWNCKIMAARAGYKRADGQGVLNDRDSAAAIEYAANNSADVISMSWGGYSISNLIKDAIDYAYGKEVVLVGAAGNDASESKFYPAGYENVLAVASTDKNDQRSVWSLPQPPIPGYSSNYGFWVDVAAPGSGIYSTLCDDTYEFWSGTSMAAPHVAGLAGLILSKTPTFTNEEVRQIIFSTTDPVQSSEYIGSGRINVYCALQMSSVPIADIMIPLTNDVIVENTDITGTASGVNFQNYIVEHGEGIYPAAWTTIICSTTSVTYGTLATWNINSIPNGKYTLRLSVSDTNGNTNKKEVTGIIVDKDLHTGWPQSISGKLGRTSHPVFDDLDGDGDKEIVVGSSSGYVHVWNHDGTSVTGWPQDIGERVWISPALADLDNDGFIEIIAGTFNWDTPNKVYVWNHDGTIISGWPKDLGGQCITTPVIGDVDNDGSLEIIVATKRDYSGFKSSYVYVWNIDGSNAIGWPKQIDLEFPPSTGSVQDDASTPSLGDIDNDEFLELIIGFNVYKKGPVYAWNHDGSVVSGWPILPGHGYTVRTAIGDINNDGDIEIVGSTNNGYLYVWNHDGTEFTGWPKYIAGYALAPLVLGDIDGDEDLEIVVHSNDDRMYAWHHDGSPVLGWPVQLKEYIGNPPWAPAVLGDINGDDSIETIAVAWGEKEIHAWHNDGIIVDGWPKLTSDQTYSKTSPAIGDIDNDGKLEMIALDNEKAYMWDLSGTYDPANIEWGMFHHDPWHTGLYGFVPADTTPPSAVTDLSTSSPTIISITLAWTAPGDDGNRGSATSYDIRYSTTSITDSNWYSTIQVIDEPSPKTAGSTETFTVTNLLPGTTYYFAIKTADEIPNWSPISNSPCGTTLSSKAVLITSMTSEASYSHFGIVSTAGDINGDDYDDVIAGAKGKAYMYFGGANMDNIADVTMSGEAEGDEFGRVSNAGDVNGDGFDDVIVGAGCVGVAKGRAYMYFGGANMDNIADVIMNGEASLDYFGQSVSTAEDVNGDGFDDVIVGANGAGVGGKAYIYFGGANMNNIADVIMSGETVADNFGLPVSSAGDVNNDGYSDVIVGACGSDAGGENAGRAYMYFGGANMDNIADVIMSGETGGDRFGGSVSSAGDVNEDGFDDVIVGASGNDAGGYNAGRAYIYYGGTTVDSKPDDVMTGEGWNALGDGFGSSVSSAGNVNKDGYNDVVVGASSLDKAYVYTFFQDKPDILISDTWVNWPENCTICCNVTNIGDGTALDGHNTTIYIDGVAVAHGFVPVNLTPNESYIDCFNDYNWTYTPPGDNLTVCADSNNIVKESNESNNCMMSNWKCGYVNGNDVVDMSDVIDLLYYVGYPDQYTIYCEWAADVNCDNVIDMSDVRALLYYVGYPGQYELNCCWSG